MDFVLNFFASLFFSWSHWWTFPTRFVVFKLKKPSWTPPNWLFPVAWTSLYICMSFAGARAALSPDNSLAMALWSLQIALNTLWTPVFFGLKNLKLGLYRFNCTLAVSCMHYDRIMASGLAVWITIFPIPCLGFCCRSVKCICLAIEFGRKQTITRSLQ